MKGQKLISIEPDVLEDIKRRKNDFGFNFSEWVNNEYQYSFMSLNAKQSKIKQLQTKIDIINKEIFDMSEREKTFKSSLSRSEKRFLLSIPRMISEGYEWKPLLNRFNISFHKEWLMEEFKKTINFLEKENAKKK